MIDDDVITTFTCMRRIILNEIEKFGMKFSEKLCIGHDEMEIELRGYEFSIIYYWQDHPYAKKEKLDSIDCSYNVLNNDDEYIQRIIEQRKKDAERERFSEIYDLKRQYKELEEEIKYLEKKYGDNS